MIYTGDFSQNNLGNSYQAQYIMDYIHTIGTKTILVEENYVDRDYLVDYTKFYARSFKSYDRFTKRIHFFSNEFEEDDFFHISKNNQQEKKNLIDSYLGFVVIKPIIDKFDNPLIGRTALKPYPPIIEGENKYFLKFHNSVSLYGIKLHVDSLRFQSQDIAVGACATTALWVTLQPLKGFFEITMHSLSEITEKSVLFPSKYRNFPSEGLNLYQIIMYLKSIGLDVECIDMEKSKNTDIEKDLISDVVKVFTRSGYPLIAGLKIEKKGDPPDFHAVVISGYKSNQEGVIEELYIHDDQIGPYSIVKSTDGFLHWHNEWIQKFNFDKISINRILIPLYPKMRLSFFKIYSIFLKGRKNLSNDRFVIDLLFLQLNEYKEFLLGKEIANKTNILITPLPKFLWIIRHTIDTNTIIDVVYDGTSVFPVKLLEVHFNPSF